MSLPRRALSLDRLAGELVRFGARVEGDSSVLVGGVREDSRKVEPGDLFVARRGTRSDGTAFVTEAVRRGAVAVLLSEGAPTVEKALPLIRVADAASAASHAAEAVYGYPSRAVRVVGITGTNGKTTASWLAERRSPAPGREPPGSARWAMPSRTIAWKTR
jgi:UDP-N-acetylmuramoyl-L-alanyl-D-glutamate--2,6-diaminopimelate ligase